MKLSIEMDKEDFFFFPNTGGVGVTFIVKISAHRNRRNISNRIARVIWKSEGDYRIDTEIAVSNITAYSIQSETDKAYKHLIEFNDLSYDWRLKNEYKMELKNHIANLFVQMICASGCIKEKQSRQIKR